MLRQIRQLGLQRADVSRQTGLMLLSSTDIVLSSHKSLLEHVNCPQHSDQHDIAMQQSALTCEGRYRRSQGTGHRHLYSIHQADPVDAMQVRLARASQNTSCGVLAIVMSDLAF